MRHQAKTSIFPKFLVALAMAGAVCAPALADETAPLARDAQAQRMITAFNAWATRWGVANTSIAVMRGNVLLASAGKGTHKATSPVPVASLSKAITAMCIAKLVDARKLSFSTKLAVVLKAYFAANPPADTLAKSITIAQLLTHSSGLNYDPSQGGPIEQLPLNQTNLDKQATITFSHMLGTASGSTYYYNNMNYAVLGLIIETLTAQPYETYCYNTVLKPVGVTATGLNPTWRVMASWGGWKISAVNYARFLAYYLPSQHLIKTTPAQWPKFSLGGGASYTLGAEMRMSGTGYNFWHSGSWQWLSTPPASFGSYYAVIQEQVRFAANYEPTLSNSAISDLDYSLYTAAIPSAAISHEPLTPTLLPE